MASALWIVRVSVLSLSVLIAIAILGLSANYVSQISSLSVPGFITFKTPAWAALAIASACINIVFVTPIIIIDFLRKGAFTSWVVIEIIVAFVVSALWLADAADATSVNTLKILAEFGLPQTCAGADEFAKAVDGLEVSNPLTYGYLKAFDFDLLGGLCRQHQAIEGLAFAAWILLMGYSVALLVLAIVASVRGVPNVWTGTVRDTNLSRAGDQKKSVPEMEKVQFAQATSVTTTAVPTPSPAPYYAQGQAPGPTPVPYAGQV